MHDKREFIKWIDHSGFDHNGWKSDEDFYELSPFVVESTGVVIKETDSYIVLVAHYSHDCNRGCGEMCIMKNCIVERKSIHVKD